ncbi:WhiB family transcriptional regulator [Streptomyces scopuliridis]|uniref:WhiB family transcriptional regulator n=1 Tax=Streptomyces scopuliridis TaxID=452529 RepID=A0ACD4ZQL7_9ACTN|nr:WhiB family transcriptional regulator [Streptomyces scopuliridis]WSC00102.1 WhiB family transcriptional regulator [Streptomyces scopuliridis]
MIVSPPSWMANALCAETDPDLFYPEKGVTSAPAREICMGCPVRTDCLNHALTVPETQGVWGGMSARQRGQLRRKTAGAEDEQDAA